MKIEHIMGTLGRRSNDYRDDQVYNHQDWFETGRTSKPIAPLKPRPSSELYGPPIHSFQTAPFEAYDQVTKHFLRKAGFNPLHLLDRVALHLQYRENDTAAFALEVENKGGTLTHIILTDSHQALLRELGWYQDKQVAELAEHVKGFKSPILRESTTETLEKVFGHPLNPDQSKKIAEAFEKSYMNFYFDKANLTIFKKNIGDKNAYAVHVNLSPNEICPERRTRLFSLTPAEEFLIQSEEESSLNQIQEINQSGICRAYRYSHPALENPSEEKYEELWQRLIKTPVLDKQVLGEIKFKKLGKETLVWVDFEGRSSPGAFTVLR